MKKIIIAAIAAAAFAGAAFAKDLKVLTIGNSFADSVFTYLPKIAKAQGEDLVLERANHGGCELDRHWSYVEREEADPDVKLYRGNRKKLREILASRDWDIVTIQQASHKSWIADSYFPYAQYLYDYVKKHAPQAEIVIQQTWSYRCDDGRFGNGQWKITQKQMYEKLSDAYAKAAEKLGTRRIPSGLAVEKAREMQPHSYKPSDPAAARRSCRRPPPAGGSCRREFLLEEKSEDRRARTQKRLHTPQQPRAVFAGMRVVRIPLRKRSQRHKIRPRLDRRQRRRNASQRGVRRPQRDEAAAR